VNSLSFLSEWGQLIFVGVALTAIVAVGWLAWRMQSDHERVARLQLQLHDAGREHLAQMRLLERNLGTVLNDLRTEVQQLREQPPWAQLATAEQVAALLQEARARRESGPARAEAAAPAPTDPAEAARHEAELRQLQKSKTQLQSELVQVRERLLEAQAQVSNCVRRAREAEEAQAGGAALRRTNEQLMAELKSARTRSRELEVRLDPLTVEIQALRLKLQGVLDAAARSAESGSAALGSAAPSVDVTAAVHATADRVAALYTEQVASLQAEVGRGAQELLALKDELQRTLREKSFIEDRYLRSLEEPQLQG